MLTWVKEKKWILLIGSGAIIVIALSIYLSLSSNLDQENTTEWSLSVTEDKQERSDNVDEPDVKEDESTAKMVDVKGAVVHPGVYKLSELEARVIDVIAKAGGLTDEADQSKINLAMKVEDEMVVYVPKKGEEIEVKPVLSTSTLSSEKQGGKVNLNTATLDELQTLPGIGPSKAQAILDYRDEIGKFKSTEELKEVTGIGDKTYEKLQASIVVN